MTGLGSLSFGNLLNIFSTVPTVSPTISIAPTVSSFPSVAPTKRKNQYNICNYIFANLNLVLVIFAQRVYGFVVPRGSHVQIRALLIIVISFVKLLRLDCLLGHLRLMHIPLSWMLLLITQQRQ